MSRDNRALIYMNLFLNNLKDVFFQTAKMPHIESLIKFLIKKFYIRIFNIFKSFFIVFN